MDNDRWEKVLEIPVGGFQNNRGVQAYSVQGRQVHLMEKKPGEEIAEHTYYDLDRESLDSASKIPASPSEETHIRVRVSNCRGGTETVTFFLCGESRGRATTLPVPLKVVQHIFRQRSSRTPRRRGSLAPSPPDAAPVWPFL